jgi:hypothetical protein
MCPVRIPEPPAFQAGSKRCGQYELEIEVELRD